MELPGTGAHATRTMVRHRRFAPTWISAASLLTVLGPHTGIAADPRNDADQSAAPGTLQEVIVTATKREESVLVVPTSISVFSAQDLDRKGVKDLEDLSASVPGLVVFNGGEVVPKTLIIRGIAPASGTASTVATYLDDTPLTVGPNSPDLKLFDLQRVEVLRGPQGTLFGSDAMGGAIRYVTPQPGYDSTSGLVNLESSVIDGGGTNYEARGAVGGPIVADELAYRGSVYYRHDGGYLDLVNEDTLQTIGRNVNTGDSWGGRLALGARPSDWLEATLSVIYQDRELTNFSESFTAEGVSVPVFLGPDQMSERLQPDYADRVYLPNLTLKANLGIGTLTSSTSYLHENINIDNDFSYFLQGLFTDNFGFPAAVGRPLVSPDAHQQEYQDIVEEIRLASPVDRSLEWLLGAYYSHTHATDFQSDSSANIGAIYPFIAPTELPGNVLYLRNALTTTDQLAGFGELSYRFNPSLKLTGGLRVTKLDLNVNEIMNGVFNGGFTSTEGKSSESPVTPKVSLAYYPAASTMIYATFAKGFREGGPNASVPTGIEACAEALAELGVTAAPASYKSDRIASYEVGAKFETSDQRLRFQGDVYQIDWDGIQETINLGGNCGAAYIDNVGKAVVRGVEAELAWDPIANLSIGLNGGYTDAELAQDLILGTGPNGPIVAAPKGTLLPYVPKETASLTAQYGFATGAGRTGYVRMDYDYRGNSTRDLNTPTDDPRVLQQDSYQLLSARIGTIVGNGYDVALFGSNLLNERTVLFESTHSYAPWAGYRQLTLPPRTIGISVAMKFK